MTNEKFTQERNDALTLLVRQGLLTLDQQIEMFLADKIDVPLVQTAIILSDNPAYFEQRFEFKN
tara:strand:- start:443 stop:634 length:192 start_codon:yes stop_codon:yes gene_type:complete